LLREFERLDELSESMPALLAARPERAGMPFNWSRNEMLEDLIAEPAAAEPASLVAQPYFRQVRGLDALRPMGKFVKDMKKAAKPGYLFDADIPWTTTWTYADLDSSLTSLDGIAWPPQWRQHYEEIWMAQLAEQLRAQRSPSWVAYQRPQHYI